MEGSDGSLTPRKSNSGACINTSKNTIRSALSFSLVGHCARQKFLGVVVMRSVPSDVVVDIFEYAISP
jgi:hypothetical protein